jgi:hypothetical protein
MELSEHLHGRTLHFQGTVPGTHSTGGWMGPSTGRGVLVNRTNFMLQPPNEPRFFGRPDCSPVPAPTALFRHQNTLRLNLFNMCVLQENRNADFKNKHE